MQLQVAIASRKIEGCDALAVLVDVLTYCGHDKLIPAIAWQNLHPLIERDAARLVRLLKSDQKAGMPPALSTLMPRVIDRILSTAKPDATVVVALLEFTQRRDAGTRPVLHCRRFREGRVAR